MRNLLGFLLAFLLAVPACPQSLFVATVNVQVLHETNPFHGSVILSELIDPQHSHRLDVWPLDVNGKATIPIMLDTAKRYRVDIVNDSHTPPCPCMRGSRDIDPSILPAGGPVQTISLKVAMSGAADPKTGLYANLKVLPN
jgi:hypothetical protein